MASGVFNVFKANLMKGVIDLDGSGSHTVNVALLDSNYSFDADHNFFTEIDGDEVSGSGYVAGGMTLDNKAVTQDDGNDRGVFDADDVTWSTSTITARFAIVYDNTLDSKDLIAAFDFSSDQSSSSGNFTIQWNANGIITLS